MQRTDNDIQVVNDTDLLFYLDDGISSPPDCSTSPRCVKEMRLDSLGMGNNMVAGADGQLDLQFGSR